MSDFLTREWAKNYSVTPSDIKNIFGNQDRLIKRIIYKDVVYEVWYRAMAIGDPNPQCELPFELKKEKGPVIFRSPWLDYAEKYFETLEQRERLSTLVSEHEKVQSHLKPSSKG